MVLEGDTVEKSELFASIFASIIAYVLLFFIEDILGINKTIKLLLAIAIGVVYYHHSSTIGMAIGSLIGVLGIK